MQFHKIEIDDDVYNYLKKNADPFIETTPNSVLRRLLIDNKIRKTDRKTGTKSSADYPVISHPSYIPSALSQVLDVIYFVKRYNISRTDATNYVAKIYSVYPQTIFDKYGRQLDKKAHEIDLLLESENLNDFTSLLAKTYPRYSDYITMFLKEKIYHSNNLDPSNSYNGRKMRNIELENKLKTATGSFLKENKNWGNFKKEDENKLVFEFGKKVLCCYSSYDSNHEKWFWGVAKKHWLYWDNHDYLALIYEQEKINNYSFILISPDGAKKLFTRCSMGDNAKKINMRKYNSDNKLRIQEFQDFDLKTNTYDITYLLD